VFVLNVEQSVAERAEGVVARKAFDFSANFREYHDQRLN
jgi:hypothetical protein